MRTELDLRLVACLRPYGLNYSLPQQTPTPSSSPNLGEVDAAADGGVCQTTQQIPLFLSPALPNYYLYATFGGKSSAKATSRTSVGSEEQKSLKRMLRNQSI